MIIITYDYKRVKPSGLSDNYLINRKDVKRVWDIDPGVIGISFLRTYSIYDHKIKLKGKDKDLTAKSFLGLLSCKTRVTVLGEVSIR